MATSPPDSGARGMSRRVWPWVRTAGGLGILAVLLWRVGADGFRDGLRLVDAPTLAAACAIGVVSTTLCAWRWRLVARQLGIRLPLAGAVADYYRALFLNTVLPGGVVGDVHRGVCHGRDVGDLGLGVRAVALERVAGQVVIVLAGLGVLALTPVPLPAWPEMPTVPTVLLAAGTVAALTLAAGALWRVWPRWRRGLQGTLAAVRHGVLACRVWPGIVASSVGVLAGNLATFLLAARVVGVTAGAGQLLPLLVLALLAMSVPLNVGGWGPREGVCAWAFAAAGLGASAGLAASVVYGVAMLAVSLPGAGVLAVRWFASRRMPRVAARDATVHATAWPVPNRSESA